RRGLVLLGHGRECRPYLRRGLVLLWHGAARRRGSAPLPRRSRGPDGRGAHEGGGVSPTAPCTAPRYQSQSPEVGLRGRRWCRDPLSLWERAWVRARVVAGGPPPPAHDGRSHRGR